MNTDDGGKGGNSVSGRMLGVMETRPNRQGESTQQNSLGPRQPVKLPAPPAGKGK